MKILLIGPLPPPIGGATVLFEQLVDALLNSDKVEVEVINTARKAGENRLKAFFRVLWQLFRAVKNNDLVSFHASLQGSLLFSPFVHLICRVSRRPWVFRGFGGNYPTWYTSLNFLSKSIFNASVLSADVVMFETKKSIDFFSEIASGELVWYPNSRPLSAPKKLSNTAGAKRFVYISQIKPSKGIYILLKAAKGLPEITVDCYGPLSEGVEESDFNVSNVFYKGVLSPDDVSKTLKQYDALVFPTFYDGEGYPGVILEAFCESLPVVTTQWRCIPEIVDSECGILHKPNDVDALKSSFQELASNNCRYKALQAGAYKQAEFFSSERWAKRFVVCCSELVARG